jgi:DNA-binding NarL/FixJ family response regulator
MNPMNPSSHQTPPGSPPIGMPKIRVLLVDDHPLVREGLAVTINQESDMAVCAHAASASEALQAAAATHPDVAVVDLTLEGAHGIDLLKDLSVQYPAIRVLVLSMHDEMLYAERAARTGARGYVMKKAPPENLVEAIRKVARGSLCFSDAILLRMHREMSGSPRPPDPSPVARLSDRELAVFELLGRGVKTRQIAEDLHISVKTVQAHCEHIKAKLELPDFTSLTRFAVHWLATEHGNGRAGQDDQADLR